VPDRNIVAEWSWFDIEMVEANDAVVETVYNTKSGGEIVESFGEWLICISSIGSVDLDCKSERYTSGMKDC
jgi:hypothetical protein